MCCIVLSRYAKIGRKGRVVRGEMLEGLRLLLCTDAELRAENAIVESIIQTPMFMTNDDFEDSVFKKVGTHTHRILCPRFSVWLNFILRPLLFHSRAHPDF